MTAEEKPRTPAEIYAELEQMLATYPQSDHLVVLAKAEQHLRKKGDVGRLRAIKAYREQLEASKAKPPAP